MSWKAERKRLSCGRGNTDSDVGDLTPVLVARVRSEEALAVEVRSPSLAGSRAVQATPQAAMPQEETGVTHSSSHSNGEFSVCNSLLHAKSWSRIERLE